MNVFVRGVTLSLFLALPGCQTHASPSPSRLEVEVQAARAQSTAPALGAVTISCESGIETAQDGVARLDEASPLRGNARFNIGSNAKSMLATLAATYVRDGQLRWDTRVGEIFTTEAASLDPVLRQSTLAQLLSHRSGLPGYDTGAALSAVQVSGTTATAQRLDVALQVLRAPPAYVPGATFVYSNAGYVVVGAMLERVGGQPFEDLMRTRVFAPLQMTSATFGAPSSSEIGQPLGHYTQDGVETVYLDADPVIPAFLQPAGDVSLSLEDYGRYLREHLCGLEGRRTRLLPPNLIQFLHTPQGEDGASLGWGRYAFGDAQASIHVGGTGTFSAFVAILPTRDFAVATVVNSGAGESRQTALDLMREIVQGWPSSVDQRSVAPSG